MEEVLDLGRMPNMYPSAALSAAIIPSGICSFQTINTSIVTMTIVAPKRTVPVVLSWLETLSWVERRTIPKMQNAIVKK